MTGLLPLGKGLYTVQSFWGPFLLFFKLHKSTEQGHTPSELKARTGFCKSTWLGSLLQCDEWLEEVFQGLKTTSLWPFLWHFSHPFSSLNFWGCLSYLKGFTAKNSVETHHLLDLLWRTSYENTFCYQVIFFFFFKDNILSMFLWWHQSQLSSELKTCALQAEEQNVVCDQFHLVISSILKSSTVSVEDGTKEEI